MTGLVVVPVGGLTAPELHDLLRSRLHAALGRLAVGTQRQYNKAFSSFAAWFSSWLPRADTTVRAALTGAGDDWWRILAVLLAAHPLVAHEVVERYMVEGCAGLASATIAQRLAALKWCFRLARDVGLVQWDLHVKGPHVVTYVDTAGPGLDAVRALLAVADRLAPPIGLRDYVLVEMLFGLGLRRAEASDVNIGHLDGHRLLILGKKRTSREPVTIPPRLLTRIRAYLNSRGDPPASSPLLATHGVFSEGTRLLPEGIYRRIVRLGELAGLAAPLRPHRLRHSGITAYLDISNGDLRGAMAFARHVKADVTATYDDHRRDAAGAASERLIDLLEQIDDKGAKK